MLVALADNRVHGDGAGAPKEAIPSGLRLAYLSGTLPGMHKWDRLRPLPDHVLAPLLRALMCIRGGHGPPVWTALWRRARFQAVHAVVHWQACDLIMRLYAESGLSASDVTVYRA